MRKKLRALGLICALWPSLGAAHVLLSYPRPRSSDDGLKSGPCGGVARTSNPTSLTSGQFVHVAWIETVPHPGTYEISFSPANDANFVILADKIENPPGLQNGTLQVKLPNVRCDACTLRIIQWMTSAEAPPSPYYSCADISLQSATPPSDGGTPEPDGGVTEDAGTPPTEPEEEAPALDLPQQELRAESTCAAAGSAVLLPAALVFFWMRARGKRDRRKLRP